MYYDQVTALKFPEEVRKFKEVAVMPVKRKEPVESHTVKWQNVQAEPGHVYAVPAGEPPARFVNTEPTQTELRRMLASSPLRKVLDVSEERPLARPPLPVNAGHRAMLLAAGHLDGLVTPKREVAHIVRGTVKKESCLVSEETTEDSKGKETTKTVYGSGASWSCGWWTPRATCAR